MPEFDFPVPGAGTGRTALLNCKGYNGRSSAFTARESGMSLSPLAGIYNDFVLYDRPPVQFGNFNFHTTTYTQEQYQEVRQIMGRDFNKDSYIFANGRQVWPPVKEEPVKSQVVIVAYEVINVTPEPVAQWPTNVRPGEPQSVGGEVPVSQGKAEVLLGTAENVGALNHLIGLRWQFGKDTTRELNELFGADVRPGQEVRFFNFVFRRTILITTRC